MPLDTAKLTQLRAIARPQAIEITAVYFPAPIGTKYYSTSAIQDLPNFANGLPLSPVEARFNSFHEFELNADVSEESVTFNFADADQQIADYFYTTSSTVKAEIFVWFPQAQWLVSVWWGLVRPPDEADYESFSAQASPGFMSQLLPCPRRGFYVTCPFIFGGILQTMGEVNANDCQYDRHVGGSRGLLNGGVPFTSCGHTESDCQLRWGDKLSFGGINTSAAPVQTDPRIPLSISRGNETNLKRPLRVVLGDKIIRDLDLLTYRYEPNPNQNTPDFVSALWAICEGPIYVMGDFIFEETPMSVNYFDGRGGYIRQPAPQDALFPGISNFSGTGIFWGRFRWVNSKSGEAQNIRLRCRVKSPWDVRIYTDATTYTDVNFTQNRVWHLLHIYRNRRWGRGYADSRFYIQSWLDAASWADAQVRFTDPLGNVYDHYRTTNNVDLQGRPTQQTITDICRAGRLGIPFQSEGKYKIVPLTKEAGLNAVPIFTDIGESRNICRDERGKPQISYSQLSDAELPNRIVLTFEDASNAHIERPLTVIDEVQQLKAGRTLGDGGLHDVPKRYEGTGITTFNEAIKLAWSLLHLGEFDMGGTQNNLRVKFTTWLVDALDIEKYKVIKIVSPLIERFGFQYFRVLNIRRRKDLKVDVVAQAYPENYYATFETPISGLPIPEGSPNAKKTATASFGSITYSSGVLSIPVI